jgi:hypothetical protein
MRWVAFALSYSGLFALCLAMPKHYRQVMPYPPTNTLGLLLRMGGWSTLIVSFAASVAADGWSFGPVEWVSMLAVTGLTLIFLLPHAPRVATLFGIAAFLSTPVPFLL